jgi:exopolysaccharide production protein ExoZ
MYFRKLQVLRGLAALAVVLFHVHEYLLILSGKPDTYFRFFGVQFSMGAWFFFVLSGFLMSYLIDTGSDRFLIRRLVRIYPTYWLAVLAVIVLKLALFDSIAVPGFVRALSLLPQDKPVGYALGIEWTLIYEVFFYFVCSAFAFSRMRRLFPTFLAAWGIAIIVGQSAFGTRTLMSPQPQQLPFSLFNLLFISGGLGYYAWKRIERPNYGVAVVGGLVAIASLVEAGSITSELWGFLLRGVGFATIIVVAAMLDRKPRDSGGPSVPEKFGDYSYALYLTHVPVITIILAKAREYHFENGTVIATVAVSLALLTGWYYGKVDLLLHQNLKRKVLGIRWSVPRFSAIPAPMGLKAVRKYISRR